MGDSPPQFERYGGFTVRVSEDARRCVVFFGISAPESDSAPEGIEYGGTGFLVQYTDDEFGLHWPYLITARHVAEALSKHEEFFIRANSLSGEGVPLEISTNWWAYPDDRSVDLAALPFGFNRDEMDHVPVPIPDLMAQFDMENAVACGDHINIVGLFRLHTGNKRSVPFVHSGTIAVMPDAKELVPIKDRLTGELVNSEVFLVEAQTLDGLSGSPVFIHEEIGLKIRGAPARGLVTRGLVKLLGVFQGSWDGAPGEILARDRNFRGNIRVPVGMGLVVPGNKIMKLIKDHSVLKEDRRERGTAYRASRAAGTDSALPSPDDVNPDHREDFMRLVDAAARKRPRDDQT